MSPRGWVRDHRRARSRARRRVRGTGGTFLHRPHPPDRVSRRRRPGRVGERAVVRRRASRRSDSGRDGSRPRSRREPTTVRTGPVRTASVRVVRSATLRSGRYHHHVRCDSPRFTSPGTVRRTGAQAAMARCGGTVRRPDSSPHRYSRCPNGSARSSPQRGLIGGRARSEAGRERSSPATERGADQL